MSQMPATAWIKAIPAVFVLIWSTGFIVARYGMPYAPPLSFLALRYALSILCFLPWIVWAGVRWPQGRAQWGHLAVTGMLMHAGYLGGVWVAVKSGMGSGLSSLVVGLQPVLTAIWLSRMGGADSRVTTRQWLGLTLGFAGLVMVVWRKFEGGTPGDTATVFNLMAALTALLCITVALLVTLPLALLETEPMQWNAQLAGAMAWSVLGLTWGGSSLLYMLIQRGAAASVTSLMYLVPPCTAAIAWLLFAEPITPLTLLGTAITALGVGLVVRAPDSSSSS